MIILPLLKLQSKVENPPMVPIVLVVLVSFILIALVAFGFIYVIRRNTETVMAGADIRSTTTTATTAAQQQMTDQINQKPLPGL